MDRELILIGNPDNIGEYAGGGYFGACPRTFYNQRLRFITLGSKQNNIVGTGNWIKRVAFVYFTQFNAGFAVFPGSN